MPELATLAPMVVLLLIIGAATGVIAGLLGVGGGIVLVPALDLALGAAGMDHAVSLHVAVARDVGHLLGKELVNLQPVGRVRVRQQVVDHVIHP